MVLGSVRWVGSFIRKVPTASGATAVQVMHKRGSRVLGIDHIGSAHDEDELAFLLQFARERLAGGQAMLPFGQAGESGRPAEPLSPVVEATGSLVLWQALRGVCDSLGFDAVRDETFAALVLARIIEPTSNPIAASRCAA